MLSDLQGGMTPDLFGQEVAHVSHSASRANKRGLTIPGTSGRNLLGSSATQDLQRSLANKLRERLTGSVSCEVTWTRWDTPWGVCLSKPRAQERTISGIDIGLWPTCRANEGMGGPQIPPNRAGGPALKTMVLACWPTMVVPNGGRVAKGGMTMTGQTPDGQKRQVDLNHAVKQVAIGLWPTATVHANHNRKGASENSGDGLATAVKTIALGLWPTATARDHKSPQASQATMDRNARPLNEVVFAMWSTIRASDGEKGGPNQSFGAGGSPLPSQVSAIGNTSNAPMENGGGSLHPEFAGWEMGYPPEYLSCAPSATLSIRVRQRSS